MCQGPLRKRSRSGATALASQRQQRLQPALSSSASLSGTTSWLYDARSQLTQESSARVGGYTHGFGYDLAGNATSFKGAARTYNAKNQRTGTGYAWDGNGNATTWKGVGVGHDREDRMTSYGTALTAGYRSDGLRAWKQDSSGVRTWFLYDGTLPVVEFDGAGAVKATNSFGAAGLVSRRPAGGTTTYYTFDQRGGTAQRLSYAGAVVTSHMQDAYGQLTSTVANTDPWAGLGAQAGYYRDAETGLQLCTFRYYDPSQGQWTTADPVSHAGGANPYAYCEGNPTSALDADGLERVALYYVSDFCAGFGDAATFGLTGWINGRLGASSVIDKSSGSYLVGGVAADVVSSLASGGSSAGAKAGAGACWLATGCALKLVTAGLNPGNVRLWRWVAPICIGLVVAAAILPPATRRQSSGPTVGTPLDSVASGLARGHTGVVMLGSNDCPYSRRASLALRRAKLDVSILGPCQGKTGTPCFLVANASTPTFLFVRGGLVREVATGWPSDTGKQRQLETRIADAMRAR